MLCPYCGKENLDATPRCRGCNSDLPQPTCPTCGVAVAWGEEQCFHCRSLNAKDTDIIATGRAWRFHGQETPLIGRTREVHILNEVLRTVVEDSVVSMVTITGPTGVGKTRLVSAFHSQLDDHFEHFTLARGRPLEGGRSTYSLFRSLLGDRLYLGEAAKPEEIEHRMLEGVRSIVGQATATEQAHLIGYLGGLDFTSSPYLDGLRQDPQRLFERAYAALARLFQADAGHAPLVLVLDDLHLAPPESLELVRYLATEVVEVPLLILCLARPSLYERMPSWGEGSFQHQRMELQPLADTEIEELFRSLFHDVANLPQTLVDLVCARAMGNALSLEQVSRILMEKGVIVSSEQQWQVHMDRLDPGQIPGSLNEMVRARLEGLTDEELRVLDMASVVGTAFWFGALVVLNRHDTERWTEEQRYWRSTQQEEELRQTLRQLRRKDLIRRVRMSRIPGDHEYQFKHRMERDTLYQQVPEEVCRLWHRTVAQWLEMGLAQRTDQMLETIAYHHELGDSPRKAAYFYIHAGDRASERYLNERAIQLYQKGLTFLGEGDAASKIETYRNLGNVHALIGDHEEALCYFREMLRHSWQMANRSKGGAAYEKMGQVYRILGEFGFAMDHFQKAFKLFDAVGDVRGIAAVLDDIGRVHWVRGEIDLALHNHQESLELRRKLGDPRSIALALGHIGAVLIAKGQLPEAMSALRESLDLRREVGDRRGEAESLNVFGAIFFGRGYYDRAVKLWEEGVELCRETGDREVHSYLLNNIAEAQIEMHELESARARLDEALSVCEELHDLRARATVLRNLGRVSLARGDGTSASARAEEALRISRHAGLKVVEGQALCLLGQVSGQTIFDSEIEPAKAAKDYFLRALAILEEVGDAVEISHCLEAFGSFLKEQGESDEAKQILEQAIEISKRLKG